MGWRLNDLTAATGAPLAAFSTPKGYAFEAQGTQHVIYAALWWDSNGWHHNELTAATGGPSAREASVRCPDTFLRQRSTLST